jgi:predicted dehydrogenase
MERVKIGVIGCGAIAQVHHMPNLAELHEQFEVTVVCDISAATAEYVAAKFHVPKFVTNYRELLDSDVDAVLHCASGYKPEPAIAAFEADKHLFIEKPMCASIQEADAITAACKRSGKVGQVGYMKVYDPAFEYAKREVDGMDNIQFIQVNHLHPNNALHMRQFDLAHFEDAPGDLVAEQREQLDAARRQAIGEVPPHVQRAFGVLSGSMIHDLYGLRVMLGLPSQVVSTEIWRKGRGVTFTLAYPNGSRCVGTWVDLPNVWDFQESLEVYGDDRRVIVEYPTGFARGVPSTVTVQGIDQQGTTFRKAVAIDWETAFARELRHFYACIVDGVPCRTPVASARDDIALIIDLIKCYTG